jgi:GT2 family glycosyltransferase
VADTLLAYLHPNEITATFHESLVALLGYDAQRGRHIGPYAKVRCASGGIPEGRNQIAAQLLTEPPEIEWLFMVDADMGFAPDTLDRLMAYADPDERPIVGGLCFAQRESQRDGMHGFRCEARPTIYDWIEHPDGHRRFTGRAHFPVNTLTPCAATGAACILIHRSVFERIHAEGGPQWFDRLRGSDGSLLGEDISFCVRAGAVGAPIHVHTGIRTTHFKNLWLGEPDFWQQFTPPPATHRTLVVVPVLHRPQNVQPLVESLRASTGLADVLFIVEPDDADEIAAVEAAGGAWIEHPGSFAQKVNAAARHTTGGAYPYLFITGDDVVFRPGWLDHAQFMAAKYGANVVGTNDLGNPRVMRGEHATHMLISTDYIAEQGASWDGPGIVCHEGYRHWYVDDEIVTVAKQRGTFQVALGSVVEHMHPIFGKAADDDVYRLGQSHAQKDAYTFKKRAAKHA